MEKYYSFGQCKKVSEVLSSLSCCTPRHIFIFVPDIFHEIIFVCKYLNATDHEAVHSNSFRVRASDSEAEDIRKNCTEVDCSRDGNQVVDGLWFQRAEETRNCKEEQDTCSAKYEE